MTADALLAETFRRSDQLLLAWAVHAAVAVAALGLALGIPTIRADRFARRAVAGLFLFLAFANLQAMLWILKQWRAVFAALEETPGGAMAPGRAELADVAAALKGAKDRPAALGELVWALVASAEFRFNH